MAEYLKKVNRALDYIAYAKNRTHTNPELLQEANAEFRQALNAWSSYLYFNREEK